MQYRDPKTDDVYMIWDRWVKSKARRSWRVYYKCSGHCVRVVPGTVWRDTEQEAKTDLVELAKARGLKKD